MKTVATPVQVALAATFALMIASPVGAQSVTAAPSDAAVHLGALIFAGTGGSKFNNSSSTGGSYSLSGELGAGVSAAGGGVTFAFGRSPVGASVTLRGGGGSGPRLTATGRRPPAPSNTPPISSESACCAESALDDFRFFAVSIGAPINIGRSFVVEPMLDLNRWKIRDTTTEVVNNVSSTTTVERSGSDPGFGLRAAWFPSRRVGVGYEFHDVKLHDAAPAVAAGPGPNWLEDSQSLISIYLRWKR